MYHEPLSPPPRIVDPETIDRQDHAAAFIWRCSCSNRSVLPRLEDMFPFFTDVSSCASFVRLPYSCPRLTFTSCVLAPNRAGFFLIRCFARSAAGDLLLTDADSLGSVDSQHGSHTFNLSPILNISLFNWCRDRRRFTGPPCAPADSTRTW